MKTEVAESLSKDIKIRPSSFLRKHSENRLRMNIPYMGQWANALALMSSPENMAKSCNYGLTLVDTMWYNAGDKSLDYNWYSKRLLLLGKYLLFSGVFFSERENPIQKSYFRGICRAQKYNQSQYLLMVY